MFEKSWVLFRLICLFWIRRRDVFVIYHVSPVLKMHYFLLFLFVLLCVV